MKINRSYVSSNNTYSRNNPQYIVIHNTDNFRSGADALTHAKAQFNENLSTSIHYYTDDGDTVYQAASHALGCWHVGVNYGGRLFGIVNNKNSIGVEMCVQAGYDFNKAFANTVAFVRQLMKETGIPADRVLQHYDVCAKNCPSQIRAKGMWKEFKRQIQSGGSGDNEAVSPYGKGDVQFMESLPSDTYRVKVSIPDLHIRKGPGTNYGKQPRFTGTGVFTIVEESVGQGAAKWGLLKSYQKNRNGWISLDYATRI
nr:N-acetylmuramoyl-L-alanine amidase [uncultured Clostridium sp.]